MHQYAGLKHKASSTRSFTCMQHKITQQHNHFSWTCRRHTHRRHSAKLCSWSRRRMPVHEHMSLLWLPSCVYVQKHASQLTARLPISASICREAVTQLPGSAMLSSGTRRAWHSGAWHGVDGSRLAGRRPASFNRMSGCG